MKLEHDKKCQFEPDEILECLKLCYKIFKEKFGIQLLFAVEGNKPEQKKVAARKNRSAIKLAAKEEHDVIISKCMNSPDEVLDGDYFKFELILKKLVSRTKKITSFAINWM